VAYDQIFKQLFQTFFYDFLSLFVPDLAAGVDRDSIAFVPTEVFTDIPTGEQREADLAARVRTISGEPELILVHTEVEQHRGPEFGDRMWEYNVLLQLREELPVLSVAVQLRTGTPGLSLETHRRSLFGLTYRFLEYWQVGLRDLDGDAYVQAGPLLGAALSVLMRPGPEGRAMLKFRAAQRIAAGDLDEARQYLLLNVVETYAELSMAEQAEYQAMLTEEGGAEVEMVEMTWGDRKIHEGIVEGGLRAKREIARRLIGRRFAAVPPAIEQRIAQADEATLDRLLDRVVLAHDLDELLAGL
jgi:hypothetical protein